MFIIQQFVSGIDGKTKVFRLSERFFVVAPDRCATMHHRIPRGMRVMDCPVP